MGKFKIEKKGYVFMVDGINASMALSLLKKKHPNHEIFDDCKDGAFRGFIVSGKND